MNQVFISAAGAAMSSRTGGGALELVFLLAVFLCILVMAYFATRFIAKKAAGNMKSRYIEIIDTLSIGADTQLLVVKTGGELFLLAKSQKQLSYLTKLELKPEPAPERAEAPPGFANSFKAIMESKLGRFYKLREDVKQDPDE